MGDIKKDCKIKDLATVYRLRADRWEIEGGEDGWLLTSKQASKQASRAGSAGGSCDLLVFLQGLAGVTVQARVHRPALYKQTSG
jgi:hypothetical protein